MDNYFWRIPLAVFIFGCFSANAGVFDCVVAKLQSASKSTGKNNFKWAGQLWLDDTKNVDEDAVILLKNGQSLSISSLISQRSATKNGSPDASMKSFSKNIKKKLKPYAGQMTVTLWKDGGQLRLIQSIIDPESFVKTSGGQISYEVFSWADINSKKIGVLNKQRSVSVECVRKKSLK